MIIYMIWPLKLSTMIGLIAPPMGHASTKGQWATVARLTKGAGQPKI